MALELGRTDDGTLGETPKSPVRADAVRTVGLVFDETKPGPTRAPSACSPRPLVPNDERSNPNVNSRGCRCDTVDTARTPTPAYAEGVAAPFRPEPGRDDNRPSLDPRALSPRRRGSNDIARRDVVVLRRRGRAAAISWAPRVGTLLSLCRGGPGYHGEQVEILWNDLNRAAIWVLAPALTRARPPALCFEFVSRVCRRAQLMSSSARGDRATAQHPRLVSALTSARDETRAKFENAISTGKRALLGRLRLPRANPTCVASISSSVGAPGSTNKVAEVAAAGKDKGTTGSDNTEQYKARRVTGTGRKNGDVETRDLAKQLVRAPPASNEVALVSTDESSSGGEVGDVSGGSDGKAGAKTGDGKGGAKTSDGKGGTKGSDNKGTSTTTTPMTADSVTTRNKDGSTASEDDTRPILISSVDFEGETPELEQLARSVVRIKPNFSYTVKEIERDVVRVFNTGLFKEVTPVTVDTRDGISLSFKLVANPTIRGFVVKGCDELPNSFAHDLFKPQFGRTLNSNLVVDACSAISRWYEKRKIPVEWYSVEVSDGILELNLEEPRIGEVEIRFIDRKTGEPIKGATRKEMITRHLKNVKPGKALHGRMLDDLNDLINTAGLENANITWKYVCAGFPKSDTHGFISNAPVTVDQAIATSSSCEGRVTSSMFT